MAFVLQDCRLIPVGQLYKSSDIDQVPTEVTQAGEGDSLPSEVQELNCSVCIKEELLRLWKESVILRSCKKDYETD
jgi:hypothetical protein